MLYEQIFKKLNEEKIDYLVVGGVALVLHGAVRFTADLDLMIMPKVQNLQKVVSALKSLGYKPKLPQLSKDLSFDMLKEWKDTRNLQVLSFYNSVNSLDLIDVLIDPVVDYLEAARNKISITSRGINIPVISVKDLLQLKKAAGRDQDLKDIETIKNLLEVKKESNGK